MEQSLNPDLTDGIIDAAVEWLEDTARWRRDKARKYPDDERNAGTADRLEELAREVRALKGSSYHYRLAMVSIAGDYEAIERLGEFHRQIGFSRFPTSAEDYLTELIDIHTTNYSG